MRFEDNDSVNQILALPVAVFVQVVYKKLLGRSPDPVELKSNVGALRCGLGRINFLANIYKSHELQSRIRQLTESGSDKAFVARIFTMYLGRSPDPEGLEHYLQLLKSGQSRELVWQDVAKSKEAKRSYTLWHELDRLMSDHENSYHPIKRWIGKRRREIRQKNREFEIISSLSNSYHHPDKHEVLESSYNIDTELSHSKIQLSITKVDGDSLNSGPRKILSRLQHAGGMSSSNRNRS